MQMRNEIDFEGSQLQTEFRNLTNKESIEKFYFSTKNALYYQPNSLFWKIAFETINKKYTKCQKIKHTEANVKELEESQRKSQKGFAS